MELLEKEEKIKYNKRRNKDCNYIQSRYFDCEDLNSEVKNKNFQGGVKKEFEINKKFMKLMFLKKPKANDADNSKANNSLKKSKSKRNNGDYYNDCDEIYSISDKSKSIIIIIINIFLFKKL